MALKYEVESLDDLDATLHGLYKTTDAGKFVLDVDGVKPLTEFNTVYTALHKEREVSKGFKDKLSGFGELTPEVIQANLTRIAELEELAKGSTIDDAKLKSMVDARLNAEIAPVKSERDRLMQERADLASLVEKYKTDEKNRRMSDEFNSEIEQAKIDPRFKELVMYKAKEVFAESQDGTFLTKETYMPFKVWLTEQQQQNPYWWGDTQGSGATGSRSTGMVNNPFKSDNLTEISKMVTENPALAKKMAEAAGHWMASTL